MSARATLLFFLLPVCAGMILEACSGSGSPPATTHPVAGLKGLGASSANWDAVHGQPTSSNGSTFGPSVVTGAGTKQRYTVVTLSSGQVSGWVMSFQAGTTLLSAENLLRADLPSDSQQTSSSKQTAGTGPAACEVVAYQSVQLALASHGNASLANGKFTVSFFEVQADGSISSSYAKVDRAIVGSPSPVPRPACPAQTGP